MDVEYVFENILGGKTYVSPKQRMSILTFLKGIGTIMPRKSATEVKIDFLVREIKELRAETKCLRADINKGKGAIWVLLVIASVVGGVYNYFNT